MEASRFSNLTRSIFFTGLCLLHRRGLHYANTTFQVFFLYALDHDFELDFDVDPARALIAHL